MATKATLAEQQKQVQDNIHEQINNFCKRMDSILLPNTKTVDSVNSSSGKINAPRHSGLGLAVGGPTHLRNSPGISVVETKPVKHSEVSQKLKDLIGYTLEIKPSQIQHEDAGKGLYLDGEANVGAVIAIYPGVTYSPAYYQYIPGYPRVDLQNPYLITRYDGTIINAKPWGYGGEAREMWDGSGVRESRLNSEGEQIGSDRLWKMLSKPLDDKQVRRRGELLELRNPLAFAHFANHPGIDMAPNVMVCSYDFPLTEKDMRSYIPNISFGSEEVGMKKFGSFWFKSWRSSNAAMDVPHLKSLVLVATRNICNEEVLLNYRLSNLKRRPSWYIPVDEEEDRRRWS
ncbi:uncharacterized protein LOC127261882 isoform X2 [Andrographis paniculata]|nr:uncharacterized protein LOC127261882 isoform X2 [Andrographis paniculata]